MPPDLTVTSSARTSSDHRTASSGLPTRRQLADDLQAEHAARGDSISSSKANRLAVNLLTHARVWQASATAEPSSLTYTDRTGELAVWNILKHVHNREHHA